jgi:hypothetical protein
MEEPDVERVSAEQPTGPMAPDGDVRPMAHAQAQEDRTDFLNGERQSPFPSSLSSGRQSLTPRDSCRHRRPLQRRQPGRDAGRRLTKNGRTLAVTAASTYTVERW